MTKTNYPYQKQPCKDCPFRKDIFKGWLGKEKIKDILKSGSFVCHKKPFFQCAGFMIIKGKSSEFAQVAKEYKIKLILTGQELIFRTQKDCIEHHSHF